MRPWKNAWVKSARVRSGARVSEVMRSPYVMSTASRSEKRCRGSTFASASRSSGVACAAWTRITRSISL